VTKSKHAVLLIALLVVTNLSAQDAVENDDDLSDKIQNPIADLVSLPFQYNLDLNDENTSTLNIQPILPFGISDNINMIVRAIVPVISTPQKSGIGGVIVSSFLTPANPGKLIWGLGPAVQFATITDELGSEKTSIAPSGLALYQNNGWTVGCIIQNFWSITGPSSAPDVNFFYSQVFITKNLRKGWYVNSAPIITANWESNTNKWTVPLGGGVGKLFRAGQLPINAQIGYYKYLEHPQNASGQLRVQVVLILPKFY